MVSLFNVMPVCRATLTAASHHRGERKVAPEDRLGQRGHVASAGHAAHGWFFFNVGRLVDRSPGVFCFSLLSAAAMSRRCAKPSHSYEKTNDSYQRVGVGCFLSSTRPLGWTPRGRCPAAMSLDAFFSSFGPVDGEQFRKSLASQDLLDVTSILDLTYSEVQEALASFTLGKRKRFWTALEGWRWSRQNMRIRYALRYESSTDEEVNGGGPRGRGADDGDSRGSTDLSNDEVAEEDGFHQRRQRRRAKRGHILTTRDHLEKKGQNNLFGENEDTFNEILAKAKKDLQKLEAAGLNGQQPQEQLLNGGANLTSPNNNCAACRRYGLTASSKLEPERWKALLAFLYVLVVSWLSAFTMVIVHDRVPDMEKYPPLPDLLLDSLPHIPWAFEMCEMAGMVLLTLWFVVILFHKHRFILMRRFFSISGTIFLLRCITMLITSLSVPGKHLECKPRPYGDIWNKLYNAYVIWTGAGMTLQGVRTCGDYMFSGHTVSLTLLNFFITEYTSRKIYFLHTFTWMVNAFGVFFILAAHEHYSIDVFIAFYISSRLFLYYHTLANNKASAVRVGQRGWFYFPLFYFFESRVDGRVPNEFEWPLSPTDITVFMTQAGRCLGISLDKRSDCRAWKNQNILSKNSPGEYEDNKKTN